ncbi:MAG: ABC transporter permease [Planctomycetes bacterium]|nr:ABC transporter permease [Planctomycetota bacterium]
MKRFFNNTMTLTWREIESTFYSPLSYVVFCMFLVLNGFSFYITLPDAQGNVTDAVRYFLGINILFWLSALFLPPVITMRLLAEEKKSGTLEPLMTAPVSEVQVVLAKYFGAMAFYVFLWIPSLLYIILVKRYGGIPDNGIILSAYTGIMLLGSSLLALGIFASSLSSNQIVSAVVALVLNLLIFFVPMMGQLIEWGPLERVLDQLWIFKHFLETFTKGVLDSFHLVFYLGLTVFFLFLAVRSLEARKWQ